MLIETDHDFFRQCFPVDPHPFISESFINLNRDKVDKIIRLIEDNGKASLGMVAGIKDGVIKSPFSAPFGGFHFHHQHQNASDIDNFIDQLLEYSFKNNIKEIKITLPPDIYHQNFNTKTVNALIRFGFNPMLPDITSWMNLTMFDGVFTLYNSRSALNQAFKNQLTFISAVDERGKQDIYDLVKHNRTKFGRPIYMTLQDILNTAELWPVDFLKVNDKDGNIVAGAINYRAHPTICYGVFWGDNDLGRSMKAMDFLSFNLFKYYKELGYDYLDAGISTESGIPNNGLLRFKETHEFSSSLRYTFVWNNK